MSLAALKQLGTFTELLAFAESAYDDCVKEDDFKVASARLTKKRGAVKELIDNMKGLRNDMVNKHEVARTSSQTQAPTASRGQADQTRDQLQSISDYAFNMAEQMMTFTLSEYKDGRKTEIDWRVPAVKHYIRICPVGQCA